MRCDTLIENAAILAIDGAWNIHEPGFVAVSGDTIAGVGPMKDRATYDAETVIDGTDRLVMPGFVNTHTHIAMAAFRGACEDVPDRLQKYIFPLEKKLVTRDLVYKASRFCLAEMVKSGTTTFADMYYFEDEVARAAKETGVRCLLGETIVDFPAPDAEVPYGGLSYARDFIAKWKGDALVTPCFAPHAPYSVDAEHLELIRKEAERLGVPVMMHVAETVPENTRFRESHGSVIRYLDSIGFLCDRLVAAHVIFVDDHDIEILAARKTSVAHCPASNAKSGRPVCPADKMMRAGIRLGLATDGPLSGNGMDMQGIIGLFPKMQKVLSGSRETIAARQAVRAATLGGAEALGLGLATGSLERGKKADLIVIDTRAFNLLPVYDWYATIAFALRPHNVETVMAGGKIIADRNGMKGFDEIEVMAEMDSISEYCRDAIVSLLPSAAVKRLAEGRGVT